MLLALYEQKLDLTVLNSLNLPNINISLSKWRKFVEKVRNPEGEVKIAVCGKYTDYLDAYKSISEAFVHAGAENNVKVKVDWISSQLFEGEVNPEELLKPYSGILVPGGFGERGIEGMVKAVRYARVNKIPYFGICLGLQCATIEFARNIANLPEANSSEFLQNEFSVIDLMPEQKNIKDKGATMRLGAYRCALKEGSKARAAYKSKEISERHRHRYEVNNEFRSVLEENGLIISGIYPDKDLVEIIELPDHPWFVGCQFHPELKSRATKAHPLFREFVRAAVEFSGRNETEG